MELKDIENLALLARLKLEPAEREALLADMRHILKYVEEINEAEILSEVRPRLEVGPRLEGKEYILKNAMREDANPDAPGEFSDTLLSAAKTKDNFIKVKKVL